MTDVAILDETSVAVTVRAELGDGDVLLASDALAAATGWELKPEGLCKGDVCVPVADRSAIERDGSVSLAGVASSLGRPVLVDTEAGVAVVGSSSADRSAIWRDRQAPILELPDLDGEIQRIEWKQKKRLLVAFASW